MVAGVQFESPAALVDTTPAVPGAPTRTGIGGGRGGGPAPQPAFPRGYEVVVSTDGTTWSNPVAQGQGKGVVNEIAFTPTRAKFVRIRQTGSADNAPWTIRRLRILEVPASGRDRFIAATARQTLRQEHRRRSGGKEIRSASVSEDENSPDLLISWPRDAFGERLSLNEASSFSPLRGVYMIQKAMAAALVGAMGFVDGSGADAARPRRPPRRRRRPRVAAAGAAGRRS